MGYFVFETWDLVEDFFEVSSLQGSLQRECKRYRILVDYNLVWQGSCSLVQLKSWKDEIYTVTKFRIWEYCWLTTKVCRRLFQVDSIIVRTFCHSSVYNFSCGTQTHINILCCFSPLFGGGRKKSFDRGGFWLSRKCVLNHHSQDQREHTSCSECCILCLFGW